MGMLVRETEEMTKVMDRYVFKEKNLEGQMVVDFANNDANGCAKYLFQEERGTTSNF